MPAGAFQGRYGPWAIVAGASEGLGAAFASEIAARGLNLILLARRGDLLTDVAAGIRGEHGVEVRTETFDLAREDLADALAQLVDDAEVGLGVYNAAYARLGPVAEAPAGELARVVDVNVRGPLLFARTLAPAMIARGRGGLVLMSSLAGLQGSPRLAAYAGSKAFNIAFAEALWAELRPQGVDVLVSVAGAIRTPGYAAAAGGKDAPGTLDAAEVAAQTLNALGNGPQVTPGGFNRFARGAMGLLPRRTRIGIMAASTKDLA